MMHELKVIHRGMDNQWYCTCGKWHYLELETEGGYGPIDGFIEHIATQANERNRIKMMHELKVIHRGMNNQWYCTCGKWHYLELETEGGYGPIDGFIEHIDKSE